MGKTEVENDVLKDGVLRIVLNIGAPLLAVQLLSIRYTAGTSESWCFW